MKGLQIYLLVFICLFFACSDNNKSGVIHAFDDSLLVVDIDACEREEDLHASYFFDNVKTIILETGENSLIERIRNIIVHNNYILVFNRSREGDLYIFHLDGRFSHTIGQRGMGPGEYVRIEDFSLDKENNEIYILDSSKNSIMKYELSTGKFINSIRYEVNRFPSSIQYFDNDLYIDACDIINDKKELLYKIDKDSGAEISDWLNADMYNYGWMDACLLEDGFFFSRYMNNPKYANLFMDTVMSITPDGLKPYLVVNTQNWVKTKDFQDEDFNKLDVFSHMQKKGRYFGIYQLIEIKNDVFFSLQLDNHSYNVFKSAKETRVFSRFVDDLVYNTNQFTINKMSCSDENGIYAVSYPHLFADFTGQSLNDILKDNLDKKELLVQLPTDSNPVIFYYKYKD